MKLYSTTDAIFVTFQNLFVKNFSKDDYSFHLNGTVSSVDDNVEAFTNVGISALSFGTGEVAAQDFTEYGAGYIKKLNAAQFSKTFKGTFLSRLRPVYRGKANKFANWAIEHWNSSVSTGQIIFSGVDKVKEKEDKK